MTESEGAWMLAIFNSLKIRIRSDGDQLELECVFIGR